MIIFKERINWFLKGNWLWLFLVLLICPYLILPRIHIGLTKGQNFQLLGLILELWGLYIVAHSLNEKLKLLQGHSLFSLISGYFKTFPRKSKNKNQTINITGGSFSSSFGTARLTISPKEDIKDVIRYFNEEIGHLRSEVKEMNRSHDVKINNVNEKIENLGKKLSLDISHMKEQMITVTVSNPGVEVFGLGCIFLGLVYGALPQLFEAWIK